MSALRCRPSKLLIAKQHLVGRSIAGLRFRPTRQNDSDQTGKAQAVPGSGLGMCIQGVCFRGVIEFGPGVVAVRRGAELCAPFNLPR